MQVGMQIDAKHVCVACCECINVFETIWSALKRVNVVCSEFGTAGDKIMSLTFTASWRGQTSSNSLETQIITSKLSPTSDLCSLLHK